MPTFDDLWSGHPGNVIICKLEDGTKIGDNQCAMTMHHGLHKCGVDLSSYYDRTTLKTCHHYSSKFKGHKPAHIRAAQEMANLLRKKPSLVGTPIFSKFTGNIHDNLSKIKDRKGIVFIQNGWGRTDHIDLWDGTKSSGKFRRGSDTYVQKGEAVWFWDMS